MLSRLITSEGVFVLIGALWFVGSAIFPQIPQSMPLGIPLPGFEGLELRPGLFIVAAFIPVAMKSYTLLPWVSAPGKIPFTNTPIAPKTEEDK